MEEIKVHFSISDWGNMQIENEEHGTWNLSQYWEKQYITKQGLILCSNENDVKLQNGWIQRMMTYLKTVNYKSLGLIALLKKLSRVLIKLYLFGKNI